LFTNSSTVLAPIKQNVLRKNLSLANVAEKPCKEWAIIGYGPSQVIHVTDVTINAKLK